MHTCILCLHGNKPNVSSNRPVHPLLLISANQPIRVLMTHLSAWLADGCAWECVCARISEWKGLTSPQTHLAGNNFLLLLTFSEGDRELMCTREQLNNTWTSLPTWRNDFIQLDNSPPTSSLPLAPLFSVMSHLWYNSHIMAWKRGSAGKRQM